MSQDTNLPESIGNKIRVPGADETKSAYKVLKIQFENFRTLEKIKRVPKHCEILIIGGGIIGSFVAYWIRTIAPNLNVVVIEKDSTYIKSSTYWSVGGFRQQFSLPENIQMSMFGSKFMQDVQSHLKCEENEGPVDIQFNHDGYLFLASKKNAEKLYENHKIQLSQSAKVRLLNKEELNSTFKWLNTESIELGSFGYENEGWVDPRKLLLAVRNKAIHLGADFIDGEVISFEREKNVHTMDSIDRLTTAVVDTHDNKLVPIKFQSCVNAAGPWAAQIAKLAGIGDESSYITPLTVSLPVEARKRYIFMFYAENGPILKVPLTIDHTGVFWRRQGLSNYYFCGLNQAPEDEPDDLDLSNIDYKYFENKIKPILIDRVPSFKDLKLVNAWAGYYEFNSLDQNLIIGRHPVYTNFIFANGSSGHGLQHAPAIGKSIAELILYDEYRTVDLKRFEFNRVLKNLPLKEIDIV